MQWIVWVVLAMALSLGTLRAQSFLTVPINLSDTGHTVIPSIAMGPSGDINVVWLDSGAILFRCSPAGGGAFSSTMVVATTDLPSNGSQPQIAVNSAGVYVAWAGINSAGGGDIFFSSLVGTSNAFSAPVNVSNTRGIAAGGSAPVPRIATDPSGGVDIVWGQSAAYFARTTNNGSSFAVTQLSSAPMARVSPRMAINTQGTVYAVWENTDPNFPSTNCPTMMFARSVDSGGHFGDFPVDDTLTVNQVQQTGCTFDVQIALGANNTIHLLWANDHSNVSSIRDLITTYQTDSGGAFAGFDKVNHQGFQNLATTAAYTPQMAIDANGNINVVWIGDVQLNVAQEVVYFSRSTMGGTQGSFSNQLPLTSAPPPGAVATGFPQIATEASGTIDIIWQQASATNPSTAYDIVLARSTDGANFKQFTLDNSPTVTANAGQIAVDGSGNAYTVWLGNSGSSADVLLNGDSQGLAPPPVFSLSGVTASISPVSAVINVNGRAAFNLSVKSTNSVAGSVTFSCGGAPAGVSCTFNPNPLNIAANGSASATLSVSVSVKPSASATQHSPGVDSHWRPEGISVMVLGMWGVGLTVFFVTVIERKRNAGGAPVQALRWAALSYKAMQLARPLALILLLIAAATGLASCGGSTHNGGGNGGGSITFPLTVRAQSNPATTDLQTISITVP